MTAFLRWSLVFLIAALATLSAQAQCSDPSAIPPSDAIQQVIERLVDLSNTAQAVDSTALIAPRGVQLTASPASDAAALTAAAEGPTVLGLAVESGVVSQTEGQLTFGTSVFGLRMLVNPSLWYDQKAYQEAETSRRFNFKTTFGGKGEKFDRDGDGKDDEPLEAKELGDIVNWEVQFRVTKSRDRREEYNWNEFQDAIVPSALTESQDAWSDFLQKLESDDDYRQIRDAVSNGCWLKSDIDKVVRLVSKPAGAAVYVALARRMTLADKAVESRLKMAAAEVDKRPLFSLAAGGIERKEQFGSDVLYFALRGDQPFKAGNLKVNIEWKQIDAALGKKPTTLRGSLEMAKLLWKGLAVNKDIEGSFAASYERYRDVPGVDDGTLAKASLKVVLPLSDGLSLPLSVTWANHKDLLDAESEIVGHFGLAFDVSRILKLPILGSTR